MQAITAEGPSLTCPVCQQLSMVIFTFKDCGCRYESCFNCDYEAHQPGRKHAGKIEVYGGS